MDVLLFLCFELELLLSSFLLCSCGSREDAPGFLFLQSAFVCVCVCVCVFFFFFAMLTLSKWQDRIIARLQQPYSLDCIPVEAEYQVGQTSFSAL